MDIKREDAKSVLRFVPKHQATYSLKRKIDDYLRSTYLCFAVMYTKIDVCQRCTYEYLIICVQNIHES